MGFAEDDGIVFACDIRKKIHELKAIISIEICVRTGIIRVSGL
ncbi:MAG: hypothetical protein SCABRO_02772 [Candidatus Scalindua brodae]|uniref:Uncharacterized protein n=1 Tax=Candidatus Scalindua brodae TaxID=237368 RepID=A0A0B0EK20_9BACT|nr:MAG: hypothetical protein SCABRO_02772 [Candidatus Scalindua brodae]